MMKRWSRRCRRAGKSWVWFPLPPQWSGRASRAWWWNTFPRQPNSRKVFVTQISCRWHSKMYRQHSLALDSYFYYFIFFSFSWSVPTTSDVISGGQPQTWVKVQEAPAVCPQFAGLTFLFSARRGIDYAYSVWAAAVRARFSVGSFIYACVACFIKRSTWGIHIVMHWLGCCTDPLEPCIINTLCVPDCALAAQKKSNKRETALTYCAKYLHNQSAVLDLPHEMKCACKLT